MVLRSNEVRFPPSPGLLVALTPSTTLSYTKVMVGLLIQIYGCMMNISVVIPAYNVAEWITRTLVSVLEQDLAEIIVVDDGSTDETAEVAQAVSPEIRVITQANRGQGAARNRGAQEASGDWLLFLDADDLLLPNAIEVLNRSLATWSSAAVVNPRYQVVRPDGSVVEGPAFGRRVYGRAQLAKVLLKNPFAGNALVKRSEWQTNPYSEDQELRSCEDLELWIRLLLEDRHIVVPSPILIRRAEQRSGSATAQLSMMRRVRRELFRRLGHDPRLSPLERAIVRYQVVRTSVGTRLLARTQNQIDGNG